MKVCPACGHPIAPTPDGLRASPTQQRIYEVLSRAGAHGATAREILDRAWAHDINGGPLSGNAVSVHISKMRPALARAGLGVASSYGPEARYTLTVTKESV